MLISQIGRRISNDTVGRPQRCRDFQRQYNLKPARCQRITVSGFTIVSAFSVHGTKRLQPNKDRAIHGTEGRSRRQMPALDVKLMAKDQDLSFQRGRDPLAMKSMRSDLAGVLSRYSLPLA
jgi:hypothetical protein